MSYKLDELTSDELSLLAESSKEELIKWGTKWREVVAALLREREPLATGIRRVTCTVGITHMHTEEGHCAELLCPDDVRRERDELKAERDRLQRAIGEHTVRTTKVLESAIAEKDALQAAHDELKRWLSMTSGVASDYLSNGKWEHPTEINAQTRMVDELIDDLRDEILGLYKALRSHMDKCKNLSKERDELRFELDQLNRVSAITMHCSTEAGMAKKLEARLGDDPSHI